MDGEVEKVNKKDLRDGIVLFEDELKKFPGSFIGDSDNCPLTHKFCDGFYVREIFIPKGTCVVGKIHKHAHPNFILSGEVVVVTEGGGKENLKAPLSIISPAGTKRIVFALEDTRWVTVHATNETDLEKIEDQVIAKNYEAYEEFKKLSNTLYIGDK